MKIIEPCYEIVNEDRIKMVMSKRVFIQYLYKNISAQASVLETLQNGRDAIAFILPDFIEKDSPAYSVWVWASEMYEQLMYRLITVDHVSCEKAVTILPDDVAVYVVLTWMDLRNIANQMYIPSMDKMIQQAYDEMERYWI